MANRVKIVTFGQVAVAFAESEEDIASAVGIPDHVLYSGLIGDLSRRRAEKFAMLHPRFMSYYDHAMMPLWKGSGVLRGGTEDPAKAVTSFAREGDEYMVAWRGISFDREENRRRKA